MDKTAELAVEFERESFRIDQLIWDSMALRAGESVLFCGCSNNVQWIKRAAEIGANVSVITNDSNVASDLRGAGVTVLRGSTSMVPARDASYDAAVAFHYLHEIDPFFHANVVSELSRVGKRLVVVEPAPPADPLGVRIAALYSRAKRDLGQFENYYPIDYWRKLLSIVKSEVTYQTFAFMRTPPRFAMKETVALIIAMMAAEETPESYLAELRALAQRPDAQLMPQSRYVIVGTAPGQIAATSAGTEFRENRPRLGVISSPFTPGTIGVTGPGIAASSAGRPSSRPTVYSAADTPAEMPSVPPRPAAEPNGAPRVAASESTIARNAFGLPLRQEPASRPFVAPSVKGDEPDPGLGVSVEAVDAASEFGWEWGTPSGTP